MPAFRAVGLGTSGLVCPSSGFAIFSPHPPVSAEEPPDCSAPLTGDIFVLRLVRIKRNLTA